MTEFGFFGLEIFFVVFLRGDFNAEALDDLNIVLLEFVDFLRVVGEERDLVYFEIMEDLGGDFVMTGVGGKSKLVIGFNGVVSLILEFVGFYFVEESDATAFLIEIDKYAATFFLDGLHTFDELFLAITTERGKCISG